MDSTHLILWIGLLLLLVIGIYYWNNKQSKVDPNQPLVPQSIWDQARMGLQSGSNSAPTVNSLTSTLGLPQAAFLDTLPTVKENLLYITQLNIESKEKKQSNPKDLVSVYEPNKFVTLPRVEFVKLFTGLIYPTEPPQVKQGSYTVLSALPSEGLQKEFSWHNENNPYKQSILPQVMNQGSCGSCWAVTAATVLTAQHALAELKAKKVPIVTRASIAEAMNCVKECSKCNGACLGCAGGYPAYVFSYYAKTGSALTELQEAYTGKDDSKFNCQPCSSNTLISSEGAKCLQFTVTKGIGIAIDPSTKSTKVMEIDAQEMPNLCQYRTVDLFLPNEPMRKDIKSALEKFGPMAMCLNVKDSNLQFYKTGYATLASGQADHAVVIVGYGTTDDGKDYWIIMNSWGPEWGDKGFFKVDATKSYIAGLSSLNVDLK